MLAQRLLHVLAVVAGVALACAGDANLSHDSSGPCPVVSSVVRPLPRPRRPAPSFSGTAVVPARRDETVGGYKFETITSADYKGRWLVAFFFPFAFTFVCPTEIVAFSEAVPEFNAIGASVVGISTDSHHTHLAWVKTPRAQGGVAGIQVPLVGDFSKTIAAAFGVLVENPADDMYGSAMRAVFLVDPRGNLRSVHINDDTVGRSVDEILRAVRAFQFADANAGMACPANWQPGDDPIATSHDGAVEYFHAAATHAGGTGGGGQPTVAVADVRKLRISKLTTEADVKRVCIRIGLAKTAPAVHHLVQPRHVTVTQIGGGITNKLFRCELNSEGLAVARKVSGAATLDAGTVLVRWFGQNTEILIDRDREADVMTELTQQGFGCPMIGAFSNGRVEKFLHGYAPLEPSDFHDAMTSAAIASQMGHMHALSLSGTRSPAVFRTLTKWLKLVKEVTFSDETDAALLQQLDVPTLAREVEWLTQTAAKYPSQVVVAHNDLLPANVMRDEAGGVMLIDFEYSDWNARGFDIANHFMEHAGFECEWATMLPSRAHRDAFYANYLQAVHHHTHRDDAADLQVSQGMLDGLEKEVSFYRLTSHMYWGLWGVLQQAHSTIPFDYLPYAVRRVKQYWNDKAQLEA